MTTIESNKILDIAEELYNIVKSVDEQEEDINKCGLDISSLRKKLAQAHALLYQSVDESEWLNRELALKC